MPNIILSSTDCTRRLDTYCRWFCTHYYTCLHTHETYAEAVRDSFVLASRGGARNERRARYLANVIWRALRYLKVSLLFEPESVLFEA